MHEKVVLLLAFVGAWGHAQAQSAKLKTEHVILVTIDWLRWQEVFGEANSAVLRRNHRTLRLPAWRAIVPLNAAARRQALLLFLWSMVAAQRQLYGNRDFGNLHQQKLTGAAITSILRAAQPVAEATVSILELGNTSTAQTLRWLIKKVLGTLLSTDSSVPRTFLMSYQYDGRTGGLLVIASVAG